MTKRILQGLLVLALGLAPWHVFAGKVSISYGSGIVAAILNTEHSTHANATSIFLHRNKPQLVDAITGESGLAVERRRFRTSLSNYLNKATLAYSTYEYEGGAITIHASSGTSIATRVEYGQSTAGSASTGESTAAGSATGAEEGRSTDLEIKRDAAEDIYYPRDTDTDIRARNFTPHPDGVIAAEEVDGKLTHYADAELKTAAEVEQRILADDLPRGGTLRMYVSKDVCTSCEANLQKLASTYDLDVEVYQLAAPGTAVPAGAEAGDAARAAYEVSREESMRLFGARKATTRGAFDRVGTSAPRRGRWSAPLASEEITAIDAGAPSPQICR